MEAVNIKISQLQLNTGQIPGLPKNPRFIKDDRYEKLKKSIEDDPEMLELREAIVYPFGNKFVIIAANMRYRACKELGFKEMPCKVLPADTPPEKLRAYAIKDNIGFGSDDFELLANEWDEQELSDFGMEFIMPAEEEDDEGAAGSGFADPTLTIRFKDVEDLQKAEIDILELLDRKYNGFSISAKTGA